MDEYKSYKHITAFILFPVLLLLIVFILISDKGKNRKSCEVLKKDMVKHGINTLSFVLSNEKYDTGNRGNVWAKIRKIYINGKLSNPEELYRKKDFIYKHCGDYYFYRISDKDSVVYDFLKINNFNIDDKKEKKSYNSGWCGSKIRFHKQYSNKLPKCWYDE